MVLLKKFPVVFDALLNTFHRNFSFHHGACNFVIFESSSSHLGVILSPRLKNSVYTQSPNLNITTAFPSFKTEPTLITRKIPPNIQPKVYWRGDKYLPFNARIIYSLIPEIFPSSVKYQII